MQELKNPEKKALKLLDDLFIGDAKVALETLECLGEVFCFYLGHFSRIRGVTFDEEWTDNVAFMYEKFARLVKEGHFLLNEESKTTDYQTIKK